MRRMTDSCGVESLIPAISVPMFLCILRAIVDCPARFDVCRTCLLLVLR